MRMWMVNPKLMCRKHLLGEHVELHMIAGCIRKGISLEGYIKNNLVELKSVKKRHNQISKEMEFRGYKHKTPIKVNLKKFLSTKKIKKKESLIELTNRCKECGRLFKFH